MTIPRLVTIWYDGDAERGAHAAAVERVLHLWYAHGAVLARTDTLRRRTPLSGPSAETQAWQWVVDHLDPLNVAAIVSALASARPDEECMMFARRGLDVIADAQRRGEGFIPSPRHAESCEAEKVEEIAQEVEDMMTRRVA